jgi:hypothetical protein
MTQNIYVPPTNGTVRMTQPVLFKGVICYGPNCGRIFGRIETVEI